MASSEGVHTGSQPAADLEESVSVTTILFGSISTLADTSELQRDAFNRAFTEHGLSWRWDRDDYRATLDSNGGEARIASYAAGRGDDVDAAAVHATKSKLFQESLADSGISPRPGVVDAIAAAKADGGRVGLVTTTSRENIAALLDALGPDLSEDTFDVVVDVSDVDEPKPDPAAYTYALDKLGLSADDAVAVEDNVGGVESAVAAGLVCVAFPNENTAGHDFSAAAEEIDRVDYEELRDLTAS